LSPDSDCFKFLIISMVTSRHMYLILFETVFTIEVSTLSLNLGGNLELFLLGIQATFLVSCTF